MIEKKQSLLEKTVLGIVKKMYKDRILGKRKRVSFRRVRNIVNGVFSKRKAKDDIFFNIVFKYHKKYCNLYDQKMHRIRNSQKIKEFIELHPDVDMKSIFCLAVIDDKMTLSDESISFISDCVYILKDNHLKKSNTKAEDVLDKDIIKHEKNTLENRDKK